MRGSNTPSFSTAASLYTAPKTGSLLEVMSLSPTPKLSMQAPCSTREFMVYSSRLLDTVILQSVRPASSSAARTFLEKYARSPLSMRMPLRRLPMGSKTSLATRIAFTTPLFMMS